MLTEVRAFLNDLEADGYSESTIVLYEWILGEFQNQVSLPLEDVTLTDLRGFMLYMRRDYRTRHAKQHNIPAGIGVPMEGKTLGEAMKDASMGPGIIVYLAGKAPNKSKQYFDPEGYDDIPSENLQKLQRAALILYDNVLNT
jgi:hypothetical protein